MLDEKKPEQPKISFLLKCIGVGSAVGFLLLCAWAYHVYGDEAKQGVAFPSSQAETLTQGAKSPVIQGR